MRVATTCKRCRELADAASEFVEAADGLLAADRLQRSRRPAPGWAAGERLTEARARIVGQIAAALVGEDPSE
jgi:hypothetical protein